MKVSGKYTISVVVTCYNEGQKIYSAIQSLRKQTYKHFEIILVNDSSPDPISNKICSLLKNEGLNVLRTENNIGPSGARNLGIEEAKGDIIIPLDADDTLPGNAVELILNTFENNKDIGFVYGNYLRNNIESNTVSIIDCAGITNEQQEIDPQKLLQNWILLGMSPFKKALWSSLNGYSMEFSFTCQDVDFQMRSIMSNAKSKYIKSVIYEWNKSETGINSSNANIKSLKKCYYNNFDFILNYATNNDAYSIAFKYYDYQKIKQWANKSKQEKKDSFKSNIFYYAPLSIIPMIITVLKSYKKFKFLTSSV